MLMKFIFLILKLEVYQIIKKYLKSDVYQIITKFLKLDVYEIIKKFLKLFHNDFRIFFNDFINI